MYYCYAKEIKLHQLNVSVLNLYVMKQMAINVSYCQSLL